MKASPSFSNRRGWVARWAGFWGVSVAKTGATGSDDNTNSIMDRILRMYSHFLGSSGEELQEELTTVLGVLVMVRR
jgi:hypothetical protein